jgi:hypothetical protein
MYPLQTSLTQLHHYRTAGAVTERYCRVLPFLKELIGCLKTMKQSQVRASFIVPLEYDHNFVGCQTHKELTA